MSTVYVVMIGDRPLAAAPDLAVAQAHALAAETKYKKPDEWEHRWDECHGGILRLMQRRQGPAGSGRRFSWTQRSVQAVDLLSEVAR